ncbi:glycoside hydrolase family 88 protein [Mucilaginibacter yixingensis]|nr:glycoside hydrolase family 88 protein [Mucilaginibacter yixingensis]
MFLRRLSLLMLLAVNLPCLASANRTKTDSLTRVMEKVYNWQWNNLETNGWKRRKTDWTYGVMYAGMMDWARFSPDKTYLNNLVSVGNSIDWRIGPERSFADDYCIGQTYAELSAINKDPRYIQDFRKMADSLVQADHSESLLWVKNIHTREWAWCDALFMGPAALGQLSKATGDKRYRDLAVSLWWKTTNYLYDKNERLFYRDSRYFDKQEKNGTKVFWSRGNGWVLAGLVRLLETIPSNDKARKPLIKLYQQMAGRVAALQQADGTWHASLLDPQSYPNKETSGTGLFCFALAYGINHHLLPSKQYLPVVNKAWAALVSSVHPDGKLGYVQPVGASPDKVTYDDTDVYGPGAFLMAGVQMAALQK